MRLDIAEHINEAIYIYIKYLDKNHNVNNKFNLLKVFVDQNKHESPHNSAFTPISPPNVFTLYEKFIGLKYSPINNLLYSPQFHHTNVIALFKNLIGLTCLPIILVL